MLDYRLDFERPYYLLLLALVPVLWWIGRHSLAGLGTWRRWLALGVRSLLVVLIAAALAEDSIGPHERPRGRAIRRRSLG